MKITLEPYEWLNASFVGLRRHILAETAKSSRRGGSTYYGFDHEKWEGERQYNDQQAACAELAAAKALNIFWDGSVDTFSAPDLVVGECKIEVRWTPQFQNIRVKTRDAERGRLVVGVSGHAPEMNIVGWLRAEDGIREEWRIDTHAFIVQGETIRPLEELICVLAECRKKVDTA
jgi:hypothetical protein